MTMLLSDQAGTSVHTREDIAGNTTRVLSCPFSLAITFPLASAALHAVLGLSAELSERETICTYIVLHWCTREEFPELQHWFYIASLPCADQMSTPLFMSEDELELLSGTNVYYAALDRKADWTKEWERCRSIVQSGSHPAWADSFTWERYLLASTYLSSRAFPSTLLSPMPSVNSPETSYPVLLPGIDSLNHRRGEKVSWIVTQDGEAHELHISLALDCTRQRGEEVFNNYGLKSNAELILGYGFSMRDNPDDCVVLKLGGQGTSQKRHEIRRGLDGLDEVIEEMKDALTRQVTMMGEEDEEEMAEWECELEVVEMFKEMVTGLGAKMDACETRIERASSCKEGIRMEVIEMGANYIRGQQEILSAMKDRCEEMWEKAMGIAKEHGMEFESDGCGS